VPAGGDASNDAVVEELLCGRNITPNVFVNFPFPLIKEILADEAVEAGQVAAIGLFC